MGLGALAARLEREYADRWVAVAGGRVVGVGVRLVTALNQAKKRGVDHYARALAPEGAASSVRYLGVIGIGGAVRCLPTWTVDVVVLPEELGLSMRLAVCLAPGIAKSVGTLLGRDVLSAIDLGLNQRDREIYLGRAIGVS